MAEGFREDFEVAVVGGGPVGAATALGLADAGRHVALVEQHQPQVQVGALGMDLRTLALSPASQALLADLGLWEGLKPTPYGAMRVWEERGTAAIHFKASDVDRAELGWMQEHGPLTQAVWQRLAEHSNAELILGEAPSAVKPQRDAVAIDLGDRQLRARAADRRRRRPSRGSANSSASRPKFRIPAKWPW